MAVAIERSRDGSLRDGRGLVRVAVALWLAWFVVVAAVYYRQLWALLAAGPDAWVLPDLGQGLRHDGLPYAREAAASAIRAIAAAAAIVLAFLVVGRLTDRWLVPASLTRTERVVVWFANGAGVWSFLFLAFAVAGLYRPAIVGAVIVTAASVAVAWASFRSRHRLSAGRRRAAEPGRPPDERRLFHIRRAMPGDNLWQAVTLAAMIIAFVCALAPEIEYDALWYHLELPRRWLAAGRPVDDATEYIALYPLTWQLLFGAGLALDGAQAARLLHWTTLLASSAVAAGIARRALGVRSAWLTAAVFVSAPTVLWEATSAYVDLATAMHVGLGVGALWMAARDEHRQWLWLAGLQCGLACATKHLALVPVAIAFALFALDQMRRSGPVAAVKRLMLPVALTLVLPSPWYVRAWIGSGNPFFPEMYEVFGAPPDRWDSLTQAGLGRFKARFGGERDMVTLMTLPWDMTMHGARYGGTLGPILLILAPVVVLVWRRSRASRWLSTGIVVYMAVWASPLSSFQLRFLVPMWVLAAPLLARSAELLLSSSAAAGRLVRLLVVTALAAVLATSLPPFIPLHEGDRSGWTGWLTHVIRRVPVEVVAGGVSAEAYLRREVRTFGAWQYLNEHAPEDARVLTFFGGDHLYARRARLWSEAVVARPVTWGATDVPIDTLLRRLEALSITHLVAPPPHQLTAEQAALTILQPRTAAAAFDVVYEDYWTVVARVRPAGSVAGTTDHR